MSTVIEGMALRTESVPTSSCPLTAKEKRVPHYDTRMLGGGAVVPYVGAWTGEEIHPTRMVQRARGGIGYADETLVDRDDQGVLWARIAARIGAGRPLFAMLHPLRQRRAMSRLLCQVCARPADHTDQGHLWLLPERTRCEANWPEGAPVLLPPLCLACAGLSVRMCPALRAGYVAIRADSRMCGVSGVCFEREGLSLRLVPEQDEDDIVYYGDPAIRWVMATQQARSLHDCTFVDLDQMHQQGG